MARDVRRLAEPAVGDRVSAPTAEQRGSELLVQIMSSSVQGCHLEPGDVHESRIGGVVVGHLVSHTTAQLLVDFNPNPAGRPIAALSTVELSAADVGRAAVLVFENGDPAKPIVIGLIAPSSPRRSAPPTDPAGLSVELDGETLTLSAERRIVLQCGKASITLTREGKVLIRGAYVLNRSSGVNRIKGGSVQIN